MSKVTAIAPANIALIKYWGARDLDRAIPQAPSLSMTLRACTTRTTVAFNANDDSADVVHLRGTDGSLESPSPAFREGVVRHLDRLRRWADQAGAFRVATENTFPRDAGLASSASGFAALTIAATRALGHALSGEQLSVLARLSGSGSAARSVLGGYVEWPDEEASDYPARQVAPAKHWDLRDVVAIVDTTPKSVSSREGHRRAETSPFYETRLAHLGDRLRTMRTHLQQRRFDRLGPLIEREAIELHCIALSSRPPIFYWTPGTIAVLQAVRDLRAGGMAAYATIDAGPNVHVICLPDAESAVTERLEQMEGVQMIIRDGVGTGPSVVEDHLF